MITKTFGAAIYDVNTKMISIEVNIVQGTNLYVVGLPDNSIKESQHRIESVLKNIHFEMPRSSSLRSPSSFRDRPSKPDGRMSEVRWFRLRRR